MLAQRRVVDPDAARDAVWKAYRPDASWPLLSTQDVPDRERNVKKEKSNTFKKWIEEDVVYIITPEERKAWNKLQTDEEREQFI